MLFFSGPLVYVIIISGLSSKPYMIIPQNAKMKEFISLVSTSLERKPFIYLFIFFFKETCILSTPKKCLIWAVLWSNHNVQLYEKIFFLNYPVLVYIICASMLMWIMFESHKAFCRQNFIPISRLGVRFVSPNLQIYPEITY